jgi:plastocyanin
MDKKLLPSYLKIIILCCLSFNAIAANFSLNLFDVNNTPMQDMVVYLEPIDDIKLEKTTRTIEVGQLGRAFTPYISVMQRGNSVDFRNKDDITHHIYSPVGKNKFSFKIKAGQSQSKNDFEALGEIAMGCNIHDWMSGYLLVVDTPLFAKSDSQGQINLDIQQAGKYKLIIWHPQLDAENNRISREINFPVDNKISMIINNKILRISEQKNEEDFDFLSDY